MEYNPRYPQPFSLSQAIALDPAVAWDGLTLEITSSRLSLTVLTEIARLRNSLLHLRRSQNELQEYLRELTSEGDLEVSQAVKENEITMHVSVGRPFLPMLRVFRASQDERIFMLKLALTHHGHPVTSEQTAEPLTPSPFTLPGMAEHPQNTVGSNSDVFPPTEGASTVNPQPPEAGDHDHGVYL